MLIVLLTNPSFDLKVTDEEIEEAFKMFDRDNSGSINHNEVK